MTPRDGFGCGGGLASGGSSNSRRDERRETRDEKVTRRWVGAPVPVLSSLVLLLLLYLSHRHQSRHVLLPIGVGGIELRPLIRAVRYVQQRHVNHGALVDRRAGRIVVAADEAGRMSLLQPDAVACDAGQQALDRE